MNDSLKKAKDVITFASPLTWLVMQGVQKATEAVNSASKGPAEVLDVEITKQKLNLEFAQAQARVAQEVAIAKRIENAAEVEIEEFYDTTGKGNLGLQADLKTQTGSLGLGGEGRKITRRVYHFRGWLTENEQETFQQDLSPDNE